ncbi:MAG: sensor histidine kinase [FCB group bacterium]|jgi:signal transduction histidine kinase|nr:sensor histidine kinase [FCB group bacterium]
MTVPNDTTGASHWLTGSLTRRVLAWMLVVSALPLFIMAYQGYHCAGQALVEQTQQHLDSVLSARSRLIEEWLIARSREVRLLGASANSALLDTVRMGDPGYEWVAAYDAAGNPTTFSGDAPPLPAAIREQAARTGEVAVVREPGGRRLLLVRALEDGAGYVAARLDAARSFDALLRDQSGLGKAGRIYVATEDLIIVSDPFGGAEGRKADPAVKHASMGHITHAHSFFHILPYNPEILRSAAPVPGTGWLLVAEADPREALVWLNTLRVRATVTGLITLVVLIFVTFWIARMLGQPLRELGRVAQRIRGGRSEERLGPLRGAEAEEVRQAFNQMLDELREKQRELVRSATLASVGELSSSIVHEMRNPLSSIKMNLQALRRRGDADPAYRELGDIAGEQAQRLEGMLDELLKYGRPVELHLEETTFNALAGTSLALVGDTARAKNIEIDLHDTLNGHRLRVDREQMTRALTNLLSNAIQAAPEGSRIRFAAHPDADRIVIEVEDAGPGLPAEAQDRLFKPFFTTKPNGTGLGLANVKKIVELHNGSVTAKTTTGALFTVTLPQET